MFFFFNDTATTEIYTLSLHDALPISCMKRCRGIFCNSRARMNSARRLWFAQFSRADPSSRAGRFIANRRSEEHTSELQSQSNLVCRLLLEKKKKDKHSTIRIAISSTR